MIDRKQALETSSEIINMLLKEQVISSDLDLEGGQLACVMKSGIRLYIGYNTVGQYGYQIMKSLKPGEFARLDNYDDMQSGRRYATAM